MSQLDSDKLSLPAWFPVAAAARYSGLSRALIYEHIADGALVSSTVKRPGRSRGRRLVQRVSLDRLIEAGIGVKSADNTGRNSAVRDC
jgi:hypothetical protein